jgi:hypothetical protein
LCFFSCEETGPPDLESKWVAFFNYEVVNKRIYCQDILICLLLVRNRTEIEEGESLIEGSEGIQVLYGVLKKAHNLGEFLFYWQKKLCGNNV